MPLSIYSKIFPSQETPDSVILYSTKNVTALRVPIGLIDDIINNSLPPEEKETLESCGFLVRDAEDEKREMLTFIRDVNALDKALDYVVVLNLDCNLGCTYCFEGTRKGKHYLSDETEKQFLAFVKQRAQDDKEEIRITYYGGEPLLSSDRIVSLSTGLRTIADRNNIKYSFTLVTNGTLLTPAVVRKLIPLGLTGAKVTVDGPEHIHNQFRPFISGEGSYKTIMRNIAAVCDMIKIQIGGNYTQEHCREFPRLLDDLWARGLTPARIPVVKFDPVVRESREFAPADFNDGCESLDEPWVHVAAIALREEILRHGYKLPKIMPAPCMIEREGNLVVNYDGSLYKCPGLIGRTECCVGTLASGPGDYRKTHNLSVWKNDECLECAYLPLCFGGCKYMTLLRDNTLKGLSCKKSYYDRMLGPLVAQDIKYVL